MYDKENKEELKFVNFYQPFCGKTDPNNRWIKMADIISWDDSSKMSDRKREELKVIRKLYEQRKEMFEKGTHSISGRIVSISKPHIKLKAQEKRDVSVRNAVEGEFGVGKRKYGLSLIMIKLPNTSETVISLNFFLLNLEKKLRLCAKFS